MITDALKARVERIAMQETVADCWACTLIRVAVRLQGWLIAWSVLFGVSFGIVLTLLAQALRGSP